MRALESKLVELIQNIVTRRLLDLHTATPGRIEKCYPETGEVDVRVLIRRETIDGEEESVELLPRVPLVHMLWSSSSLWVPPDVGDLVLLVFCERSLDEFKLAKAEPGELSPPVLPRFHSYSDAVAIASINPEEKYKYLFDTKHKTADAFFLAHKGAIIAMDGGGNVFLGKESDTPANDSAAVLGDKLQTYLEELTGAIKSFVDTIGASPIVDPNSGIPLGTFPVKALELSTKITALNASISDLFSDCVKIGKGV